MTTMIKVFAGFGMMVLAVSCSESSSRKERYSTTDSTTVLTDNEGYKSISTSKDENKSGMNDTISAHSGSSSAAVENPLDTLHKFIRTADMKFKVNNVEKTIYKIEDIVTGHGGFVTYTNLASTIDNTAKTLISPDSSAETTSFTVANYMVIRVPNYKLDTTLKDIAKMVGFLDYRLIKADDIAGKLLGNKLLQKRTANHNQRLAHDIDIKPRKLDATTNAEENILNSQEAIDNAQLDSRSLDEQQKFSTVKLEIYQPQTTITTIVANVKPIPVYEAGIGSRLLDSLKFGWDIVEAIFVFIASLWVFILLGIAGYFLYRKYWKTLKVN